MNYLAHLHLASVTQTSMEGAILGDFFKGSKFDALPANLALAVRLHRKIDSWTDEDEAVKEAKQLFRPDLRRFAGIALDVCWDHCLANAFHEHHHLSRKAFVTEAYAVLSRDVKAHGASYERLLSFMFEFDWLNGYADFEGVRRALQGLSRRRPGLGPLAECAPDLEANRDALNDLFRSFYPKLSALAQSWVQQERAQAEH